jgi:hypothetical protein
MDQLPLGMSGSLREPPYTLAQATIVAHAFLAYYQDEPTGCLVHLPGVPLVTVPYLLESTHERTVGLKGLTALLETSERPGTARHLFGEDLHVLRWALRVEKDPNLLVGWLYAATFSDLTGIEEAVMDLAEAGATPQIQAGAMIALLLGLPDRILHAYDPRVRALAQAAILADDAIVREQGQWLLSRADAVASGQPSTTPGEPKPAPLPTVPIDWPRTGLAVLGAIALLATGIAAHHRWARS